MGAGEVDPSRVRKMGFPLGVIWIRRGYMTFGLHAEVPLASLNHGKLTSANQELALAA